MPTGCCGIPARVPRTMARSSMRAPRWYRWSAKDHVVQESPASTIRRTSRASRCTEAGPSGWRTGRIQGQPGQPTLVENDDDAARDDDAGPGNQAQRGRGRPENPVDGEGPEDGGVLERSDDRGWGAPKGVGQPHLPQCSGDADSDEPNPVGAEHRVPVADGQ